MAPDDDAALVAGLVAAETQRRIVRVELRGEGVPAADGLDEIADIHKHHVAVAKAPGRVVAIVAVFLADVEHVVRGFEFVHDPDGVFVGGVGQLATVEHAYAGDVVAFDAAVDTQATVGLGFFFVVVDVGVARIPVLLLRAVPAFERDFDVDVAVLGQYVGAPARTTDLELAVAEEERRARAALQQRVARLGEVAHGVEDMNFGVEFFTAGRIDDGAVQDAHSGSFT